MIGGREREKGKKLTSLACPALFHRKRVSLHRVDHTSFQRTRLSARLSPIVVANISRQARARVWINSWSSYCERSTPRPEFPRCAASASKHTKAAMAAAADMSFRSRQSSTIEVLGELIRRIFAFAYTLRENYLMSRVEQSLYNNNSIADARVV